MATANWDAQACNFMGARLNLVYLQLMDPGMKPTADFAPFQCATWSSNATTMTLISAVRHEDPAYGLCVCVCMCVCVCHYEQAS